MFRSGSPTTARCMRSPYAPCRPLSHVHLQPAPLAPAIKSLIVHSDGRQLTVSRRSQQVLRWFGYFREAVVADSSPDEQRVRRIAIHFYLEDSTLDVSEPKQDDSGILQVGSPFHCWAQSSSSLRNVNKRIHAGCRCHMYSCCAC